MEENKKEDKNQLVIHTKKDLIITQLLYQISYDLKQETFKDLKNDSKSWLNIQEVTRETFKKIVEIINKKIKVLEILDKKLNKKLDVNDIENRLNKRATVEEVKNLVQHLCSKIEEKVDKFYFEDKINKKINREELDSSLKNSLFYIDSVKKDFFLKKDFLEYEKKIESLEKNEFFIKKDLSEKIDENHLENKLKIIEKRYSRLEERLNLLETNQKNGFDILENKINKEELNVLLDQKAEKNNLQVLEEKLNLKAEESTLNFLQEEIIKKIDKKNIEKIFINIKNDIEVINHLQIKKDIKEINEIFFNFEKNLKEKEVETNSQINNQNEIIKEIENGLVNKINKENFNYKLKSLEKMILNNKNLQKNINKVLEGNEKKIERLNKKQKNDNELLKEKMKKIKNYLNSQNEKFNELTKTNFSLKSDLNKNLNTSIKELENILLNNNNNLEKTFNNFKSEINIINEKIKENEENYIKKKKYNLFQKEIKKLIKNKTDKKEIEKSFFELNELFEIKINEILKISNLKINNVEKEIKFDIKKKINYREIDEITKNFINKEENVKSQKIILTTIQDFEKRINNFEKKILKINKEQKIDTLKDKLEKSLKKIEEKIILKISKKDLKKKMLKKANTEDINKILINLQKNLKEKVERLEIAKLMEEQDNFNQFFCTELILARYKWKSGFLLKKNIVPLEFEIVNTLKANFIWEKNCGELILKNGGLYEIKFGFFGKNKMNVKIFLNDKIVFSNKNLKKNENRFSSIENNLMFPSTGFSKTLYLLVPDNSRLAVGFIGEMICEGFLNVKRY